MTLASPSPRGTIHSLKATSNYGDYTQTYLSYPINTFCREELNHNKSRYWWAATDSLHGYSLISVTRSGQTSNDRVLMLDWRFMAQGSNGLAGPCGTLQFLPAWPKPLIPTIAPASLRRI